MLFPFYYCHFAVGFYLLWGHLSCVGDRFPIPVIKELMRASESHEEAQPAKERNHTLGVNVNIVANSIGVQAMSKWCWSPVPYSAKGRKTPRNYPPQTASLGGLLRARCPHSLLHSERGPEPSVSLNSRKNGWTRSRVMSPAIEKRSRYLPLRQLWCNMLRMRNTTCPKCPKFVGVGPITPE